MNAATTRNPEQRRNRRLAWIVLAAPIAWFVHEVAAVAFVGRSCVTPDVAQSWPVVVLAVIAAGIAIGGAIAARVTFKGAHRGSIETAETRDRVEFLAQLGFFLNLLLLLNIVMFGLVPYLAGPCS